jgi:hypothetical protein
VDRFKKGVGSGSWQLVVKSEKDFGVTQQVYVIASGTQWSAAILRQQEKQQADCCTMFAMTKQKRRDTEGL